ncbi:plasmid maintenance toxin (PemK-like) [Microvirga soli]|uniref:plasmid maintenance toxin (PemK-like) n=1 Tax=Microvirga soli TaxID=1854496 RepID=UPI00191E3828|nr:plasmid maintenance toxin (PemK-like) [Microvirga soli]
MRIPAKPPVGHVIAYEYLWLSQKDDREDGAKVYPTAIVVAREDRGPIPLAYALGISHKPPAEGERALEVPPKLKRHLGLDDGPSWIYTDQVNVFAWPGPDIRPAEYLSSLPRAQGTCVVGALPSDWFALVLQHLDEGYRLHLVKAVPRTA